MLKKVLLLALPITALALLSFGVTSADYRDYDCDGYRYNNGCWHTEKPIGEDLDIRKLRRYCVRNYCYVIYEICEENGRCVEEAKRIRKDEYKRNWNYWARNNSQRYFKENFNYPKRDFEYIYRGSHYGNYNNRYWNF